MSTMWIHNIEEKYLNLANARSLSVRQDVSSFSVVVTWNVEGTAEDVVAQFDTHEEAEAELILILQAAAAGRKFYNHRL